MSFCLLRRNNRALSLTLPLILRGKHFCWGKTTPACFLHFSVSTTNSSLFEEAAHENGCCNEDSEDSPLSKNLTLTDSLEEKNLGREMHPGAQVKSISAPLQGIYRAMLIGEAGYTPHQKILRVGKVTIFALGTAGMRNNRKPYEDETPEQYARRSFVQWHRIAIYQHRLGDLAMEFVKKGSQVYVEGNLETRVFLEPESNSIKHIQEIAVRKSGRIIFLDQNKVKV